MVAAQANALREGWVRPEWHYDKAGSGGGLSCGHGSVPVEASAKSGLLPCPDVDAPQEIRLLTWIRRDKLGRLQLRVIGLIECDRYSLERKGLYF